MCRVTVLTCTYNGAATLRDTYQGLLSQDCRDFEWVLVDDGSSDGTQGLVEGWARRAPFPVRYHHQANQGRHVAHNLGVRLASGAFVLGVDADDWLLPHAISTLLAHWVALPEGSRDEFATVEGQCVTSDGCPVGVPLPAPWMDSNELELRHVLRITGDRSAMRRRDVLLAHPFPEYPGERFLPERIVWDKIALTYRSRYVSDVVKVVRIREGSLSRGAARSRRWNAPCGWAHTYAHRARAPVAMPGWERALYCAGAYACALHGDLGYAWFASRIERPAWRCIGLVGGTLLWCRDLAARRLTRASPH